MATFLKLSRTSYYKLFFLPNPQETGQSVFLLNYKVQRRGKTFRESRSVLAKGQVDACPFEPPLSMAGLVDL